MAIADLPHAVLREVSVNEIALDQKENPDAPGTPSLDDPVKFRLGAYPPAGRRKFYLGTISFDVLRSGGHRTEVGFLKFAVDEFVEADGDPVPMVELFLTRTTDNSTDAGIDRVLTISRKGCRLTVPLSAPSFSAPIISAPPSRFRSDNSRYVYNVQGDPTPEYPHGRIVQYARHESDDPAAWTPVAILRPDRLTPA